MEYVLFSIIIYCLFYNKNSSHFNKESIKLLQYGKKKQQVSIIAVILLILFAGLRNYTIGYDLPNYKNNFDIISDSGNLELGHAFEYLFQLLNLACASSFGNSFGFNALLLLISTIEVLCVIYAAKRMSKDISLTMFLYVALGIYLKSFDQVRQGVAIALLMCATVSIMDKKPFNFIWFVFAASLFHKTAIIFIFMYVLVFSNTNKFNYFFVLLSALGIVVFYLDGYRLIQLVCDTFSLDYYDRYIVSNYGKLPLTTVGVLEIIATTLAFVALFVYSQVKQSKGCRMPVSYNVLLNLFLCSVIFYYISAISGTVLIFERFIYYFFWSLIFLIPSFLNTVKNQNIKKVFKVACLVVGCCYLFASTIIIDAYGIMPYSFFIN